MKQDKIDGRFVRLSPVSTNRNYVKFHCEKFRKTQKGIGIMLRIIAKQEPHKFFFRRNRKHGKDSSSIHVAKNESKFRYE